MFCFIFRWMITQALDSQAPVSRLIRRHLHRCPQCRNFAAATTSIHEQLARDVPRVSHQDFGRLQQQIVQALPTDFSDAAEPPRGPMLWQALAASVVLFVVSYALLSIAGSTPGNSSISQSASTATAKDQSLLSISLAELSPFVESPLRQEYKGLRQNAEAAVQYILANLENPFPRPVSKTPAPK